MNFSKKLRLIFLQTLIIAGFTLRFYQLGEVPDGLTVDEADMAFSTYSIIKTGADVYGQKLPFFFQALDDYKPSLVFYTTIPAIMMFGLNEFAVRFAPFIFGMYTIVLIFTLARLLYPKVPMTAYILVMLTAFAPWHIALSRAMVWYIELTFAYLLVFISFFLGLRRNKNWFILSGFILGLTLYIYYAALIYLPFLIFIFAIIFYKDLIKLKWTVLISMIVFTVISLPAASHYFSPESKSRFNAISVLTADITLPTSISEIQLDQQEVRPFSQIIHNRRFVYLSALLDNYVDYFNLDYLFITAKNTRYFYVNNVGLFYAIELPFFLYGLYKLVRRREKSDLLILGLLIIGPIPASITLGSPFPHRGIITILAIQLISAIGVVGFFEFLIKNKFLYTKQVLLIVIILYLISIYFFLHQYFIHSPNEFTSENNNGAWYSTVREAIPIVNKYKDDYDKIIFTWSSQKLVPAVYFLFYNQIDPKILQQKASRWTNEPPSFRQIYDEIGNIEFRPINWEQDKNLKNTLFVGYQNEFPKDIEVIDKTYLPNGEVHFLFVKTD